jgi:hypothetical protein
MSPINYWIRLDKIRFRLLSMCNAFVLLLAPTIICVCHSGIGVFGRTGLNTLSFSCNNFYSSYFITKSLGIGIFWRTLTEFFWLGSFT